MCQLETNQDQTLSPPAARTVVNERAWGKTRAQTIADGGGMNHAAQSVSAKGDLRVAPFPHILISRHFFSDTAFHAALPDAKLLTKNER
jgi:hypothetical protein